jgi:hypothetical protein
MIIADFLIATYLILNSNLVFIEFKSYFLNLQTTRLMLGIHLVGDRLHSDRAIGCTLAGAVVVIIRKGDRLHSDGGCGGVACLPVVVWLLICPIVRSDEPHPTPYPPPPQHRTIPATPAPQHPQPPQARQARQDRQGRGR